MSESILKIKSFAFAVLVVSEIKMMQTNRKEFVLSQQLLRSGTSIGANIREAQNAESKKDFIHKLAIAQKECDETLYWLDLLYETHFIDEHAYNQLSSEATQLLKMIRSSILTAKKNLINS